MEVILRLSVFFGILLCMLAWEVWRPKRRLQLQRLQRWTVNLGLALFNLAVMRISVGAAAWQVSIWAAEQPIGVFNVVQLPSWLAIAGSLLLLDLAIYAQHVAAHRWRWFWRLHQVHHTDIDFDTTTAVRFHPLEILLSMAYKVLLVLVLGAPPMAVILFEVILNGCALFNHGNVSLPEWWEKWLRYLLVTPDMHRIHHSALPAETDSNYGFSLSCWDRVFKTYTARAQLPQTEMKIGLNGFRDANELGFLSLLALPFKHLRLR